MTDESQLSFSAYLHGAQVQFEVKARPPLPPSIEALNDEEIRIRATEAWNLLADLDSLLHLWWHFVICGHQGTRIDAETEEKIAQRFPSLEDYGRILDTLAGHRSALRGRVKQERDRRDVIAGVTRGSTHRLSKQDRRLYKGGRLQRLLIAFRDGINTRLSALNYVGIQLPFFSSGVPPTTVVAAITAVTFDHDDLKQPIDFSAKVAEPVWGQLVHKLRSEAAQLARILQESPRALFIRPSNPPPTRIPRAMEDRDRWIYEECMNGILYKQIITKLKNDHREWDHISSRQGIRKAAKRYAERHGLPPPPKRR